MSRPSTRAALLEQGALLFARHGVGAVTAKQLHEAAGARNESALHYHFGDRRGLVTAILRDHVAAVEARRQLALDALEADGATSDLRSIVRALAGPMADDLASPLGRAHLRIVAQLDHPALGDSSPFTDAESTIGTPTPSGEAVVGLLLAALGDLPARVRAERLVVLRATLLAQLGARARLIDDDPRRGGEAASALFLENLLDMLVGALTAPVSGATRAVLRRRSGAAGRDRGT